MKRITGGLVAIVILATGCGGGQDTGNVEGLVKRELVDQAVLNFPTEGVLTCDEKGDRRYDCHLSGSDVVGDCDYAVRVSEDERRVTVSDVTKKSGAAARWSYCH